MYIAKVFKFTYALLFQTMLDEDQQQTRLIENTVQKLMVRLRETDSLVEERFGLGNQFEVVYMFRPNGIYVILAHSFRCNFCEFFHVWICMFVPVCFLKWLNIFFCVAFASFSHMTRCICSCFTVWYWCQWWFSRGGRRDDTLDGKVARDGNKTDGHCCLNKVINISKHRRFTVRLACPCMLFKTWKFCVTMQHMLHLIFLASFELYC